MVRFSRGAAYWYLGALAVWVAGFVVLVIAAAMDAGTSSSVPGSAIAALLGSLFAAGAVMGALAWTGSDPAIARVLPAEQQLRWVLLVGLRWLWLSVGGGAPAAFRALDDAGGRRRGW